MRVSVRVCVRALRRLPLWTGEFIKAHLPAQRALPGPFATSVHRVVRKAAAPQFCCPLIGPRLGNRLSSLILSQKVCVCVDLPGPMVLVGAVLKGACRKRVCTPAPECVKGDCNRVFVPVCPHRTDHAVALV